MIRDGLRKAALHALGFMLLTGVGVSTVNANIPIPKPEVPGAPGQPYCLMCTPTMVCTQWLGIFTTCSTVTTCVSMPCGGGGTPPPSDDQIT